MRRIILLGVTALLLSTCSLAAPTSSPGNPAPGSRRDVAAERAAVTDGGRALHVEFVGAAPFAPDDPCSANYELDLVRDGGELRFHVVRLPHPADPRGDATCRLVGFVREITVNLEPPVDEGVVIDGSPLGTLLFEVHGGQGEGQIE